MEPIVAEEWRPVKGYEGLYEVSNLGRVKSLARTVKCGIRNIKLKERTLKPLLNLRGYYQVALYKNGKAKRMQIHTLVAFSWMNSCPGRYGKENGCYNIDHKDKNRLNNQVSNLRWILVDEHIKQGGIGKGENHKNTALNEKDVISIRSSRLSYKELAIAYNVSYRVIYNIIQGVTWKHLEYAHKAKQIELRKKK